MPRRLALACLVLLAATFGAEAGNRRRAEASDGLKAGMPLAEARRRLLRGGWHPYADGRNPARCAERPDICRAYPEGGTVLCSFEYLDTRRRRPRLDDEVLRMQVRIGPCGRPIYDSHRTTSYGGHG